MAKALFIPADITEISRELDIKDSRYISEMIAGPAAYDKRVSLAKNGPMVTFICLRDDFGEMFNPRASKWLDDMSGKRHRLGVFGDVVFVAHPSRHSQAELTDIPKAMLEQLHREDVNLARPLEGHPGIEFELDYWRDDDGRDR